MDTTIFKATDIGHREENQDQVLVLADKANGEYLIVVADGLGGHEGGKLAATAVIDSAKDLWSMRERNLESNAFLQQLVEKAHANVRSLINEEMSNPQSTLCALYINDSHIKSVHVGDSRVLQFENGQFVKRTTDHSQAQILVFEGKIKEDEIANHESQNKLFRSIGGDTEPKAEIVSWECISSHFVVCTDGFWELFTSTEMFEAIAKIKTDKDLEQLLRKEISNKSKHDNTSVVVVEFNNNVKDNRYTQKPDETEEHTIQSGETFSKSKIVSFVFMLFIAALIVVSLFYFIIEDKDELMNNDQGKIDSFPTEIPTNRKVVSIKVTNHKQAIMLSEELLQQDALLDKDSKLKEFKEPSNIGDTQIVRAQQYYKGIPVYGGQVILMIQNGSIINIESKTFSDINIDIKPKLSEVGALDLASNQNDLDLKSHTQGELIVYKKNRFRLAWEYEIETSQGSLETFIVDANTAEVLLRFTENLSKPSADWVDVG